MRRPRLNVMGDLKIRGNNLNYVPLVGYATFKQKHKTFIEEAVRICEFIKCIEAFLTELG